MVESTRLSASKAYSVPIIIMIILGLVLFLPAGSIKYWAGWIWWTIISVITFFITAYFLRKDRSLLSRRMKVKETERQPGLIKLFSFLSLFVFIFPGFDFRFHWSTVPVWLIIAANALVFTGYVLIFLTFRQNSYASTIIQVEEVQPVISTGLYALVRHPMYLGLLLIILSTPLALGSYWALIFALLFIPTILFRISKEENLLLRNLPEYASYRVKTKYRLLPLVW